MDSSDVRLVTPGDLREMLLYAVDRDVARRIFARHFDRSLDVERSVPTVRDRLQGATTRALLAASVAALLVVAVVVAVTGGGYVGPDAREATVQPATGPPPTDGPAGDDDPADKARAGGSLIRYPPGVDASGLDDLDALVEAHRRATADTSWSLLYIHRGSQDLLNTDRRWVTSRQRVDRLAADRYWYRAAGIERTGPETFVTTVFDDYADGMANYRRHADPVEPAYNRTRIPRSDGSGVFTAAAVAFLKRYLATTDSRVESLQVGNETWYRVVASGTPIDLPIAAANYTAVALVDRRGVVHRLTVTYTRLDRLSASPSTATPPRGAQPGSISLDGVAVVRFQLVYRNIGGERPAVPPWYETAKNVTNGSTTGPWPSDPEL